MTVRSETARLRVVSRAGRQVSVAGQSTAASPQHDQPEPQRLVVLGASNVTKSFATALLMAHSTWLKPLHILAAHGHGRSYGLTSHFFGRSLPGIIDCGLWNHLGREPRGAVAALVTDIGNDIPYDVPVGRIAQWVEACVIRLQAMSSHTVIAELPLASLARLSPTRYRMARMFLFPGSRVTWHQAHTRAQQLNDAVLDIAQRHCIETVQPELAWYGYDPIHWKVTAWPHAWQKFFQPFSSGHDLPLGVMSWWQRCRLKMLAPERRWWFAWERRRLQPCASLGNGTWLSLY